MKKLLIVAVLALCLTALVGVGASGAGGNTAGAADPKTTFVYQMVPGDSVSYYNDLYGLLQQGYNDVFFVINMGSSTGTWSMTIEDCCILGDTMLAIKLGQGGTQVKWATSPTTINLGPTSMPRYGWVLVITGYIVAPGGFPAGYYFDIYM